MSKIQSAIKQFFSTANFATKIKLFDESNFSEIFPEVGFLNNEQKEKLEKLLKVKIKQTAIFEQALTHRSYIPVVQDKKIYSNERLEYLGDAILDMVIAEFLFFEYNGLEEGELTTMRSRIVNAKSLAFVANKMKLYEFMRMSFAAEKLILKGNESSLADALEAIIAAIYLDSGIEKAKKFISRMIIATIVSQSIHEEDINYKSKLLELFQSQKIQIPSYKTLSSEGPDHDRIFTVGVYDQEDNLISTGKGKSKKQAEQEAAKTALEKISNTKP